MGILGLLAALLLCDPESLQSLRSNYSEFFGRDVAFLDRDWGHARQRITIDPSNVQNEPSLVRFERWPEGEAIVNASRNRCDQLLWIGLDRIKFSLGDQDFLFEIPTISGKDRCAREMLNDPVYLWGAGYSLAMTDCFEDLRFRSEGAPYESVGINRDANAGSCASVDAPKNQMDMHPKSVEFDSVRRNFWLEADPWPVRGNEILLHNRKLRFDIAALNFGAASESLSLKPEADCRNCKDNGEKRSWVFSASSGDQHDAGPDQSADKTSLAIGLSVLSIASLFGAIGAFSRRSDAAGWVCAALTVLCAYGAILR